MEEEDRGEDERWGEEEEEVEWERKGEGGKATSEGEG